MSAILTGGLLSADLLILTGGLESADEGTPPDPPAEAENLEEVETDEDAELFAQAVEKFENTQAADDLFSRIVEVVER